jgi:hypothetical protein
MDSRLGTASHLFCQPRSGRAHGLQNIRSSWRGRIPLVLSHYNPKDYFVEYTVSASQRLWFISVRCRPKGTNTSVIVTYSYTGLTEQGNELNKLALDKMYARNLKDWEEAINYYLATGKRKEN